MLAVCVVEKEKIFFLGGVPGVGKTSMAGELAKKFDIKISLSGDYLREDVRETIKKLDEMHLLRQDAAARIQYLLSLSVYDAWKYFGEKNTANILKGFEAQSQFMCAGMAADIRRAVKNGESIIIESLYINQSLIDTITENSTIAAYLYISDFETHVKRLNEREEYSHFNSPGSRLVAQLDVYREIMTFSEELSKRNGIPTFDVLDFAGTMKSVLDYASESSRKGIISKTVS
ncbi:MAG: AAA family ATPase [Candidatus Marsarchaeota archaeon]|jgi:mevalonate-3-phosphate-5-kinase|nr:AAA family ATPase [Candidatus Marsarchaeota archaeon]